MRQVVYPLLLILFTRFCCFAQTEELMFSYIGVRDGLNEQSINGIQQDKKGYIWIATHNALQRYDGQRFLTFRSKKNEAGAIPESAIRSLAIDHKNRLWMIVGHTRVGYFDVDRFIFHEVPVRYSADILAKSGAGLFLDASGNLMMVLVGKAVLTYNETADEMAEKYNPVKWPPGWKVNHLWQHKNSGIYWMGCDSGLVKFNAATQQLSYRGHNAEEDPYIKQFEKIQTAVSVYLDGHQRMWLIYWPSTGLVIKHFKPGETESFNWRDKIDKALQGSYFEMFGVTELSDGSIWMSGQNLLAKLNERNNDVEIIKNNMPGEFSIRYDRISQLVEDREKNIWIASDKGLFRFNPSAQIFKPVVNRLPGKNDAFKADITDVLETTDGEILVSTWGAGIFSYDKYFNPVESRLTRRNTNEEAMIWCMLQTAGGDIWKGGQDGYVYIYHSSTGQTEKLRPAELEHSTVRQLAEDKQGNIWLGTQRGYLAKWDFRTRKFSIVQKFQSIISRVYIDDRGDVWVCTANAGLQQLNTDGKILNSYTADTGKGSLAINGCADILQYNDSLYFIAGDALNILNIRSGEIKHMTTDHGLPSTNISNVVKDKQGFLWMTCAFGVVCFHPLNGKLSAYNSTDGVHTTAFSLAASTRLKDGRIIFGTNHDMLLFDPFVINSAVLQLPKVEISGISIHNTVINADSVSKLTELKLSYHQNSLVFQFTTLSYQNIFPVYYKMENIDKDWKTADNSKMAIYNYLPPGNYIFKVACKKPDGSFGPLTTVTIRIDAPFWKSWWFYGLLALGVMTGIYWLDKERMERMRREQDIRTSIAGNLHQEVNTTLQNINVLSEIAGMKADKDPGQSKDYIHEIKQKSRNMVTALNDVLWSIDPANDSMEKNIHRMQELAESLKNKYNVDIEVHVENSVARLNLDMKKRHEFISIYKLSITTLVEQLKAGYTTVHLDYSKGILHLKIHSRVSNFSRGNNAVIKNIHQMNERSASVGASLDIQSDDKNTGIILAMKV